MQVGILPAFFVPFVCMKCLFRRRGYCGFYLGVSQMLMLHSTVLAVDSAKPPTFSLRNAEQPAATVALMMASADHSRVFGVLHAALGIPPACERRLENSEVGSIHAGNPQSFGMAHFSTRDLRGIRSKQAILPVSPTRCQLFPNHATLVLAGMR